MGGWGADVSANVVVTNSNITFLVQTAGPEPTIDNAFATKNYVDVQLGALSSNAIVDSQSVIRLDDDNASPMTAVANANTVFTTDISGNINFAGSVFINDTVNSQMTKGLTINQGGADDHIMTFKSSDVAHGMTSQLETDSYMSFSKQGVDEGGVLQKIISGGGGGTNATSWNLYNLTQGESVTTGTGSGGSVIWQLQKHDGANGFDSYSDGAMLFSIKTRTNGSFGSRYHLNAIGDSWQLGNVSANHASYTGNVTATGGLMLNGNTALGTGYELSIGANLHFIAANDYTPSLVLQTNHNDNAHGYIIFRDPDRATAGYIDYFHNNANNDSIILNVLGNNIAQVKNGATAGYAGVDVLLGNLYTKFGNVVANTGDIVTYTGKFLERGNAIAPAGIIEMWSGNTAPNGWLLCDGSNANITAYSELFAVMGFQYGDGGGGGFLLPDFQAKFPLGANGHHIIGNSSNTSLDISGAITSSSGGPTTHSVNTTTVAASAKDSSTTSAVTGVNDHSAHTHTTTPPFVVVNFIVKY